jgi:hypothetical protein
VAEPRTFTRVYRDHGDGQEYPATPERIRNVIASMHAAAVSTVPFKVRLRLDDGSVVVLKPKGRG